MKKLALFAAALLAACAGQPMLEEPTAVATMRVAGSGSVEARALIESRDHKPAWVRLYVVPAAYSAEAERAITAGAGKLGRWAMFPVVSHPMEGREAQPVQLVAPSGAVRSGDLVVLAIDPISPSRFITSGARIEPVGEAN